MKTLGSRLALLYSLVSTITLFAIVAGGFYFLNRHLVRGIDRVTEAECDRIKEIVGPNLETFSAQRLEDQILETTKAGLPGFFVEISKSPGSILFRSEKLSGQAIPHEGNREIFNVTLPNLGELRVHRFSLGKNEIMVATSMTSVHQVMDGYAQMSVILVSSMLILSLVAGFLLSNMALRPLRVIQETAYRIRSDNLSERIPVADVEDEISDLARLLNETFDRLESSFQQIRRFSAEASHELKTPLSIVRLQAEKLLTDGGLTDGQEDLIQSQLEEIAYLDKIIEQLLFLSKAEANAIRSNPVFEDPTPFVKEFVNDAHILAEHAGVRFEESIKGHLPVAFDPKWLRQILLNLLSNALRVSAPGDLVTLASDYTLDAWCVIIEDEGPGVPVEQQERIFERFVRLSTEVNGHSQGSGLGLAICRSMIEMLNGTIHAESGIRKSGLKMVCKFPLVEKPALSTGAFPRSVEHPSSDFRGTRVPD